MPRTFQEYMAEKYSAPVATPEPPKPRRSFREFLADRTTPEQAYVAQYNRDNPDKTITQADLPEGTGLLGRTAELARGVYRGAFDTLPESLGRAMRGGNVDLNPVPDSFAEKLIARNERDARRRIKSKAELRGDKLASGLARGPESVAASVASGIGGGVIGGKAGALIGGAIGGGATAPAGGEGAVPGALAGATIGSIVGAATSSGATFYRMAKDQFVQEMRDAALQANPNLTEKEWGQIRQEIEGEAVKTGIWEAGPEAASQALTAGLFKGGGLARRMIPGLDRVVKQASEKAFAKAGIVAAKYAGSSANELATEYATYLGQEGIRQKAGLRKTAPSAKEFFGDQAPAVLVGSLFMEGAFDLHSHLTEQEQAAIKEPTGTSAEPAVTTAPTAEIPAPKTPEPEIVTKAREGMRRFGLTDDQASEVLAEPDPVKRQTLSARLVRRNQYGEAYDKATGLKREETHPDGSYRAYENEDGDWMILRDVDGHEWAAPPEVGAKLSEAARKETGAEVLGEPQPAGRVHVFETSEGRDNVRSWQDRSGQWWFTVGNKTPTKANPAVSRLITVAMRENEKARQEAATPGAEVTEPSPDLADQIADFQPETEKMGIRETLAWLDARAKEMSGTAADEQTAKNPVPLESGPLSGTAAESAPTQTEQAPPISAQEQANATAIRPQAETGQDAVRPANQEGPVGGGQDVGTAPRVLDAGVAPMVEPAGRGDVAQPGDVAGEVGAVEAQAQPVAPPVTENAPAPEAGTEPQAQTPREPWEMTRAEAVDKRVDWSHIPEAPDGSIGNLNGQVATKKGVWTFVTAADGRELVVTDPLTRKRLDHQVMVQQAVANNQPVPRAVLEEYAGEPWADEAIAKLDSVIEKKDKSRKTPPRGFQDLDGMPRTRLIAAGGMTAEAEAELRAAGALDGIHPRTLAALFPKRRGRNVGKVSLDQVSEWLMKIPDAVQHFEDRDAYGRPSRTETISWLAENLETPIKTGKALERQETRREAQALQDYARDTLRRAREENRPLTIEEYRAVKAEADGRKGPRKGRPINISELGDGSEVIIEGEKFRVEANPETEKVELTDSVTIETGLEETIPVDKVSKKVEADAGDVSFELPAQTQPPAESDIFTQRQAELEKQPPRATQSDIFGGSMTREAMEGTGTPSVNAKIGPSDAPRDVPDMFASTTRNAGPAKSVEEVQPILDRLSKRWKNGPTITAVKSLADLPERIRTSAEAEQSRTGRNVRAIVLRDEVYIITDNMAGADAEFLTLHEVIGHRGLEAVLGKEADNFYGRLALERENEVKAYANEQRLPLKTLADRKNAAREWLADRIGAGEFSRVRSALKQLADLMRRAWARLTGKPMASLSDGQIARLVLAAHGWTENGVRGPVPGGSLFSAGESQSLRERQQNSPEFKRWFGDSKVVDENGKPLVVYHGTTSKEFSKFMPWSHFGTAKSAEDIIGKGANGRVYPVYLSIQKPLELPDMGAWLIEDFAAALAKKGVISQQESQDILLGNIPIDEADDFLTKKLTDAGFDGVQYKNANEDIGSTSYIVFSPTKIKSATANVGTFDANNPDIRYSTTPGDESQADPKLTLDEKLAGMKQLLDELEAALQTVKQEKSEGKAPKPLGRPDLALAAENPQAREQQAMVDEVRKRRGEPEVRKDEEVNAAATERLDADYEGEKLKLLNTAEAGGMLNDVETAIAMEIVARETLAATRSDDAATIRQMLALTNAYRQTGTEQARAMRQRRDKYVSPADRWAGHLSEMILEPDAKITSRLDQIRREISKTTSTIRKAELEAERESLLSKQTQQILNLKRKLAAQGIDIGSLDTSAMSKDELFHVWREISAAKATWWDKQHEYWLASILSGFKTHAANFIGNSINSAWDVTFQRASEALVNTVVRDPNSAQWGEFGTMFKGMVPGFKRGVRVMMQAWRTEMPVFQDELFGYGEGVSRIETLRGPKISGKKGRIIRAPLRALLAMDEFQKAIIVEMEAGALAYRQAKQEGHTGEAMSQRIAELMNNTESEVWEPAYEKALDLTFQNDLGPWARVFMNLRMGIPGVKYIIPFIKTPTNIFKTGVRKSPLGSVLLAARLLSRNPNYTKRQLVHHAGEQILAIGLTFGLLDALGMMGGGDDGKDEPLITGSQPYQASKKGERELAYRAAPPNSIRIWSTWYSYQRIEPFAVALSTTVDLLNNVKRANSEEETNAAIGNFYAYFVSQIKDKTYMRGMSDVIEALNDPSSATRWISSFSASWVPNIVRQTGRESDPKLRETGLWGKDAGFRARYADRVAYQVFPTKLTAPPPRVDLWGDEIKRDVTTPVPATDFLYRLTVPIQRIDPTDRNQTAQALDRLILNWNNQHPNDTFAPQRPQPNYTLHGERKYWTDEEYYQLSKRTGELALQVLTPMVGKLNIEEPTEREIEFINDALKKARARAREDQMREQIRKQRP